MKLKEQMQHHIVKSSSCSVQNFFFQQTVQEKLLLIIGRRKKDKKNHMDDYPSPMHQTNIIMARMELKTLSRVKIRAENWYSSPINQSLTLVAAVTKTLVRVHNVAKEHRKKLISAIAISKNMPQTQLQQILASEIQSSDKPKYNNTL